MLKKYPYYIEASWLKSKNSKEIPVFNNEKWDNNISKIISNKSGSEISSIVFLIKKRSDKNFLLKHEKTINVEKIKKNQNASLLIKSLEKITSRLGYQKTAEIISSTNKTLQAY